MRIHRSGIGDSAGTVLAPTPGPSGVNLLGLAVIVPLIATAYPIGMLQHAFCGTGPNPSCNKTVGVTFSIGLMAGGIYLGGWWNVLTVLGAGTFLCTSGMKDCSLSL